MRHQVYPELLAEAEHIRKSLDQPRSPEEYWELGEKLCEELRKILPEFTLRSFTGIREIHLIAQRDAISSAVGVNFSRIRGCILYTQETKSLAEQLVTQWAIRRFVRREET